jgi:thiol-disulfide isomerase/thioredoxin
VKNSALTGLLVVVVVLAAATAYGLWRGQRDGRLRPVVPAPPGDTARDVAPVQTGGSTQETGGRAPEAGVLATLGVQPGTAVTLVQFSSAFCAPCRATRRVLDEVTGLLDDVRHIEVDAESHLDAVRALNVWRTPTVLVVDAHGRVVQRASGVPGKAQVIAAVASLLTGARS